MIKKTTCRLLVISCIDFRLPGQIVNFLNERGYQGDFDLNTLPGASLAPCCASKPHWQQTVKDVIEIAKMLHNIEKVLIIDHEDCGAFHNFIGRPQDKTHEMDLHKTQARKTKQWLMTHFPDLEHEFAFINLDGTIITLL